MSTCPPQSSTQPPICEKENATSTYGQCISGSSWFLGSGNNIPFAGYNYKQSPEKKTLNECALDVTGQVTACRTDCAFNSQENQAAGIWFESPEEGQQCASILSACNTNLIAISPGILQFQKMPPITQAKGTGQLQCMPCSTYNEADCKNQSTCTWDNKCVPKYPGCAFYQSETECTTHQDQGCNWDGTTCKDKRMESPLRFSKSSSGVFEEDENGNYYMVCNQCNYDICDKNNIFESPPSDTWCSCDNCDMCPVGPNSCLCKNDKPCKSMNPTTPNTCYPRVNTSGKKCDAYSTDETTMCMCNSGTSDCQSTATAPLCTYQQCAKNPTQSESKSAGLEKVYNNCPWADQCAKIGAVSSLEGS